MTNTQTDLDTAVAIAERARQLVDATTRCAQDAIQQAAAELDAPDHVRSTVLNTLFCTPAFTMTANRERTKSARSIAQQLAAAQRRVSGQRRRHYAARAEARLAVDLL